jgi:hypothetical protein
LDDSRGMRVLRTGGWRPSIRAQVGDSGFSFLAFTVAGCWRGILKMVHFYLLEHNSSDGPIVVDGCRGRPGGSQGVG